MKPIIVNTTVPRPREEVFDFLDVLGNHEPFTNHMLVDWTLSGPREGVGARARMRANLPGPKDWVDMEVFESARPERISERAIGAQGRRRTRGTYTLAEAADGGTHVTFELAYELMPTRERLISPLLRLWLQRGNQKAMDRLRATFTG